MNNVGTRLGLLPQGEVELASAEGGISVTRTSIFSKKRNTMVLPVDEDRIRQYFGGSRVLVQDLFPELDADQREFLMTGATPEEWKGIFG